MALNVLGIFTRENKTLPDIAVNVVLSIVVGTMLYTVYWLWTLYINSAFTYEVFYLNLIIIVLWAFMGLLIAWISTVPVRRTLKWWKGLIASIVITGVIAVTGFIGVFFALVFLFLLGVPPEMFS